MPDLPSSSQDKTDRRGRGANSPASKRNRHNLRQLENPGISGSSSETQSRTRSGGFSHPAYPSSLVKNSFHRSLSQSSEAKKQHIKDKGFNIAQLNLHSGRIATIHFNTALSVHNIQIALLQDYYIDQRTNRPAGLSNNWQSIASDNGKVAILTDTGTNPIQLFKGNYVVAISLQNELMNLAIINAYAPPKIDFEVVLREIELAIQKTSGSFVLGGDFNAHSPLWGYDTDDQRGRELLNFIATNGLQLLNTHGAPPTFLTTHSKGWPDLSFVTSNLIEDVRNWRVLDDITLSDHKLIIFTILGEANDLARRHLQTLHGKHRKFTSEIRKKTPELLNAVKNTTDELQLDSFTEELQEFLKNLAISCYKLKKKSPIKKPTWFTNELKIKRSKLRALRRKAQGALSMEDKLAKFQNFKKERASYKRDILKAKSNSWKNFCGNIKDEFGKQFKLLTNKISSPAVIPNTLPGMNNISLSSILELFLDTLFLTDASTPHEHAPFPLEPTVPSPAVTIEEVNRIMRGIKKNKAPGPDMIDYRLLIRIHEASPSLLTTFFNRCLDLGYFPRSLKKGNVVLFLKPNKPLQDPRSYRPICLLPSIGKTLERLIHGRLSHHLFRNSSKNLQFGFKTGLSSENALNNVFKLLNQHKLQKQQSLLISFDISGAFDGIRWPSLSGVIDSSSFPTSMKQLLRSFLSEREISLTENKITVSRKTYGGCPQGSCLGPFLWNLLADKILNYAWPSHTVLQSFADDFLLIINGDNSNELVLNANSSVKVFCDWAETEGLKINWPKTKLLHLNRPLIRNQIIRTGIELQGLQYRNKTLHTSDSLTYLGITLDKNLNFVQHCLNLRSKVQHSFRLLSSMSHGRWGLPVSNMKLWYRTVVEKILTYASPIWAFKLNKRALEILSSCQRPFLLACTKAYRTAPTLALNNIAGIWPIEIALKYEARKGKILRLHDSLQINDTFYNYGDFEKKFPIWKRHPAVINEVQTGSINKTFQIFSDGSKSEFGVGAAFVVFCGTEIVFIWRAPLRPQNSVFQAEQLALLQALKWAISSNCSAAIHTDSKSALQAIDTAFSTNEMANETNALLNKNNKKITINWVRAHDGIIGNEKADIEAKRAARNLEGLPEFRIPFPHSLLKYKLKALATEEWQTLWEKGKTGRTTYEFFPTVSQDRLIGNPFLTSILTDHGPFPAYLFRFKISSSPLCVCGEIGDAYHYLTDCNLIDYMLFKRPSSRFRTHWKEAIASNEKSRLKIIRIGRWLADNIDYIISPV